jgi:hypothetical protein
MIALDTAPNEAQLLGTDTSYIKGPNQSMNLTPRCRTGVEDNAFHLYRLNDSVNSV